MRISSVRIKNFRLLSDIDITLEQSATVIVGRNNSGKTSFTEIFKRLLSENSPKFKLEDFSLKTYEDFWNAFVQVNEGEERGNIELILPSIEITLTIEYNINENTLGFLNEFIIDLDPASTTVIVSLRYQIKKDGLVPLFENIDYCCEPEQLDQQKRNFFRSIQDRIPQNYTIKMSSIDPTDASNEKIMDPLKLRSLLLTGFINAQRGLDDVTHKDNDVLGKSIERMLDIVKSLSTNESSTVNALDLAVKDIQYKLDTDFNEHLNQLVPALSLFGYPGLKDPSIHTETTLDVKKLLSNHTKVRYSGVNGISLPESYNGLGSRNLIYILFQLYEFFKLFKSSSPAPGIQLVFIEEPEAHLHPQMQEVFVRKINEIIDDFSSRFNFGNVWPVQVIITTHSTHIANEVPFDSIRYFTCSDYTQIKDLRFGFSGNTLSSDKEFLHKYLTLTRCDLFFADKAILIEGPTERLLMKRFIDKTDEGIITSKKLSSKYISIIEVGGAYAHHFFSFLDFIGLQTLIITDLDSINGNKEACPVAEGATTSNAGIKAWFPEDQLTPEVLQNKSSSEKIIGVRRLAYQIPENKNVIDNKQIAFQSAAPSSEFTSGRSDASYGEIPPLGPCGRSFEDAFMLANLSEFGLSDTDNNELARRVWEMSKKINKTDFAIKYAIERDIWNVPLYIQEGLMWLSEDLD